MYPVKEDAPMEVIAQHPPLTVRITVGLMENGQYSAMQIYGQKDSGPPPGEVFAVVGLEKDLQNLLQQAREVARWRGIAFVRNLD